MNSVLKDVLKNGTIMFVVGAALALIAPALGNMVGLPDVATSHSANPAWMGAFFGAFGALHAAVTPLFRAVFADKKEEAAAASPEKEPAVHISISSPEVNQTLQQEPEAGKFRDTLAAERAHASAQKIQII